MDTDQAMNTAKNLTTGNKILGGSAVGALVAANLTWYKFDAPFVESIGIAGRRFTFGWLGLVLLLGAAGMVLAPAFGAKAVKTDSLATEQIALGLAGAGSLLWLIRLVSVPGFGAYGRSVGLFLAIAAAAGVVYGVVASMKEKDIAMPTVDDLKNLTSSTNSTAPAAPVQAPHPAPTQQPQAPVAPVQAPHAVAPHQPPAPVAPVQPPAPPTVNEF